MIGGCKRHHCTALAYYVMSAISCVLAIAPFVNGKLCALMNLFHLQASLFLYHKHTKMLINHTLLTQMNKWVLIYSWLLCVLCRCICNAFITCITCINVGNSWRRFCSTWMLCNWKCDGDNTAGITCCIYVQHTA
jgi:hypothetical protein